MTADIGWSDCCWAFTAGDFLAGASRAGSDRPTLNHTPAATTNKELPWKPVASPQGLLPLGDYPDKFKTFDQLAKFEDTKKVVEELLNATVRKLPSPVWTKRIWSTPFT